MSSRVLRGLGSLPGVEAVFQVLPEGLSRTAEPKKHQEELEELRRRTREAAQLEGYSAGFLEGRAAGYDEGFEAGRTEALESLEAEHRRAIESFRSDMTDAVAGVHAAVEAWYEQAESNLGALALEIARRALGVELQSNPELVVELTKAALQEVRLGTRVRVRANPFDSRLLEARSDEIRAACSDIRDMEIVPDISVANGCVIDSDGGVIDARVDAYLARLAEGLAT